MKCLTCLYYFTETCLKESCEPSIFKEIIEDLDELGFDGYCAEHDVFIGEECFCSYYMGKAEV